MLLIGDNNYWWIDTDYTCSNVLTRLYNMSRSGEHCNSSTLSFRETFCVMTIYEMLGWSDIDSCDHIVSQIMIWHSLQLCNYTNSSSSAVVLWTEPVLCCGPGPPVHYNVKRTVSQPTAAEQHCNSSSRCGVWYVDRHQLIMSLLW